MGVLTQCFSYLKDFRVSKISNAIKQQFSFEKGIVRGCLSFAIGLILHLIVLFSRIGTKSIGFGEVKLGIYGLFFLISSVQIVYFSFMFYLFNRYQL